jgi:hypothetical protein
MEQFTLGIDVAKAKLDVALRKADGKCKSKGSRIRQTALQN